VLGNEGDTMTDWKERAERAEAELARLREELALTQGTLESRERNIEAILVEYARLRALLTRTIDHVSYGSRRSYDGVGGYKMREAASQLLLEIMAALAALYRDAPPAQPAEPVQRLSDERAAFEAWHNEYRTQELVRRDDTYYNTHVRCRWEGWQARAIESALQPGWRDIESAPKESPCA